MLTRDKRSPAFTDLDRMWFGKYNGQLLQDIPVSYLKWLYDELLPTYKNLNLNTHTEASLELTDTIDKLKLFNYIWNSMDAIEYELKDEQST